MIPTIDSPQDIRGLRGSAPYHWDGIPGDPFGGVNTANILSPVELSCDGESRRVARYTSSMARWPPRA